MDDVRYDLVNHEPSAWLREAIVARLVELAPRGLPDMFGIVAFNLTDSQGPGDREDRTCDRCRAWTPPGQMFYTSTYEQDPHDLPWPWSQVLARHQVLVAYGVCSGCVVREVGPLEALDEQKAGE